MNVILGPNGQPYQPDARVEELKQLRAWHAEVRALKRTYVHDWVRQARSEEMRRLVRATEQGRAQEASRLATMHRILRRRVRSMLVCGYVWAAALLLSGFALAVAGGA